MVKLLLVELYAINISIMSIIILFSIFYIRTNNIIYGIISVFLLIINFILNMYLNKFEKRS